ncbi:MAG TPA: chalcone isomerase family protein, partial [Rhodocyclaceae bacterium]|nr:chalcone isomerase family protein [Rhodocyclaceae bacterium]
MKKLNKLRPAAAVFALCFALGAQALEVAGVKVEERVKQGATELVLNGAGIRTKVIFKVYVGALYASQKTNSAAALIDGGAKRMSLTLLRDLDADSLFDALRDGLAANHSEAEMTAIKPQVDQLAEIMKKIGGGKTGNVIDLDFTADGLA